MVVPQTEIIVTKDGAEIARKIVAPGDYVIGRDADCELHLEVDLVSQRHAQLTVNYDHALIEDLGSSSGTFVNGKAVTESTRLWPNQKIQVGAATIELRRLKTDSSPDHSLAPQTAAVRSMLPEEFLRDKKYAIGGVVAQGGMGAILDAQEATTERTVAMKVMLDGSSPEDLTRFVSEAKVTAQLEHPNIVPVHELSVDENDQVFYTMKFVRGITLKKVLEEMAAGTKETIGKYPLGVLLTIFQKVCDAVAFAHSKGVIHRDLKPENIMLGDFGEVLVMDWGLAKRMGKSAQSSVHSAQSGHAPIEESTEHCALRTENSAPGTLAGSIMGTPQYMAPEQARGEIEALDARSDIYSLGAILYQMLVLCPPVEGRTLDEILAKVSAGQVVAPIQRMLRAKPRQSVPTPKPESATPEVDPSAPTLIHTGPADLAGATAQKQKPAVEKVVLPHLPGGSVPESLNAVVMKAMALEQAARYQSIAELQADIMAHQSGFATRAENASVVKQVVLLIKRHKGIFSTAAAAWLIITVLAVWFVINVTRAKKVAENERNVAAHERDRATENERAARAAEAIAVTEKEAARQSLAKAAYALAEAAQREGNGLEMQATLNEVPDDLRDSTWSYLFEQSDTSIARVRTETNDIQDAAPHPRMPGVFAVVDSMQKVTLLEVRTGKRLLQFEPAFQTNTPDPRMHVAFSPDGERIAIGRAGADGGIVIHSARDGKKVLGWDAPGSDRLDFSPDGKLLLQTENLGRHIHIWDAADGKLAWSYPTDAPYAVRGVFSPDGQQVVTTYSTGTEGSIRLVNARDGTLIHTVPNLAMFRQGAVRALAMHPDGTVVGAGDLGWVRRFDPRDGRVLVEFFASARGSNNVAVSPDGQWIVTALAVADGRQDIRVWNADTGRALQALPGGSGGVRAMSVHPLSGELLVSGPLARVWSLTGTWAKWNFRLPDENVSFFGSDDLLFARNHEGSGALLKLQAGNPELLWKPTPLPSVFYHSSVSADGRLAAIGSSRSGVPIVLLRNPGPAVEQIAELKPKPKHSVSRLRLSPKGGRLVAIEDSSSNIELLNTTTGTARTEPTPLERNDIKAFHDVGWLDERRLLGLVTAKFSRGVAGSEEWIVLWDATTGKILQTAVNHTAMDALAVAPDGLRFAEAGADKRVRIRDATTLAVLQEFRAHDGPITALAWHPTKRILATASTDLSIRLWNLETGRRLEELRGPNDPSSGLAFSPSGQRLACSGDATRIWEPKSLNDQPDPAKADGWKDLLAPLTPAIVTQTGHGWRMEGGAFFSPGNYFAILPLPGTFSGASYQVRIKIRHLTARNGFHLVLPVSDRMTGFELDGWPESGIYTGLNRVNGQAGSYLPGTLHGQQVTDAEQHDLEVAVRLDGPNAKITTTLDDKPLYEWTGPTAALSQNPNWATTPPGALAFGANGSGWVVYEVKVKRLEK